MSTGTSHDWQRVTAVSQVGNHKRLRLESGRFLYVHPFACAGRGDVVRSDADGRVSVRTEDAVLQVSPAFRLPIRHELASDLSVSLVARELVEPADFEAYRALLEFHYRSHRGFGRRAVLIIETADHGYPNPVGFVEVTTPFLHLRNRNLVLDAAFTEPGSGVSWAQWDMETRSRLINVIARISRIVIHPELRGLGLTGPLLKAASAYARERWQVAGVRPIFIEITADMLRFMPFVDHAGFRYIGESEGNLARIAKDITYLSKAGEPRGPTMQTPEAHSVLGGSGKGILNRQKRDIGLLLRLRAEMAPDVSVDDFLRDLLQKEDVDDRTGELLMPLIRRPKPTYIKGLTLAAEAFLTRRASELGHTRPSGASKEQPDLSGALRVANLNVSFKIDTGALTSDTAQIRRAFGLERDFEFRTGVTDLSFVINPGQICYVYGASGSGKSTLLGQLAGRVAPSEAAVRGTVTLPSGSNLVEPTALVDGPLISAIGAADTRQAILALNSAGLSEPRLYLSSYSQLSAGQKYRATLAKLICSGTGIWLLDEFADGLDNATAVAVGRNFAKAARRANAILVVGTVRAAPLVNSLEPDIVIHLSQLTKPQISTRWRVWAGLEKQ